MIDIHSHLHFSDYDVDRGEIVRRAQETGVNKIICVGTSPEDNQKAVVVAEKYDDVFASVGIHPHFFKSQNKLENKEINEGVAQLKRIAQSSDKVIAIGECGLDYFSRDPQKNITGEQRVLQKEVFLAQMELARELKLPVIIHTRASAGTTDAYEDLFEILRGTKYMVHNAILHCYQGDIEITKKFIKLPNVYFSFAGNITYPIKKSLSGAKNDLREIIKLIPLERLYVETDCPYLAPEKKRGGRNEPAYVWLTARKVCTLEGITENVLEAILDKNFCQVFEHC